MMKLRNIVESFSLYEGLTYTHDVESSAELLNRYASNYNMVFSVVNNEQNIRLEIYKGERLDVNVFDKAILTANNLGWYPTYFKESDWLSNAINYNREDFLKVVGDSENKIYLFFDAKYDAEILKSALPDKAYHITPKIFLPRIQKVGLVPKSKEKFGKQPGRIYLLNGKEGGEILTRHEKFYPKVEDFVLLSIDVKTLSKERNTRFFVDPAFDDYGFYTYENIPPNYIHLESYEKRPQKA